MAPLSPDTPIGRIVAEHPASARLFERLDLEYCCGGDRSLASACAEEGLDADTVLRLLDADVDPDEVSSADDSTDWTSAPLPELIDHIVETHHAYLRRELPRLQARLGKVTRAHGTETPWVGAVKDVFDRLKPSMEAHIRKEEEIVFPFIRRRRADDAAPEPDGLDGDPIALMEEEHDETGAALKRMRDLSDGFTAPDDGCAHFRAAMEGLEALEADTHRHVHKENNILFPRARRRAA